jgi:uncharacterized protein YlxW (UPF0749 family)
MNQYEMIVLIVAIVMFASVLRAKFGSSRRGRADRSANDHETAEAVRLRQEVKELKERLKVLERITVEKENSLSRQIDDLRDR